MLEIEAKFRVASHDTVRRRLADLGAVRVGAVLERNHIFDTADRSLLVADRGLRVREIQTLDGAVRPAMLTYKGERLGGELKTRREIETTIGDAAAACEMLTALGFVEAVCFEKRRESWQLGACHVELDEVPHLGCFVEIEGPHEEAIHEAQRKLGLSDVPSIRTTYIAMLVDHCRARGLPAESIVF